MLLWIYRICRTDAIYRLGSPARIFRAWAATTISCSPCCKRDLRLPKTKAIKPTDLNRIIVNATAQPKNVMFPTDARLLNRAREILVWLAPRYGVKLRLSHAGVGSSCSSLIATSPTRQILACLAKHFNGAKMDAQPPSRVLEVSILLLVQQRAARFVFLGRRQRRRLRPPAHSARSRRRVARRTQRPGASVLLR